MFGFIVIYDYVGEGAVYDYRVRETDAVAAIKKLQSVDPNVRVLSVQIVPADVLFDEEQCAHVDDAALDALRVVMFSDEH